MKLNSFSVVATEELWKELAILIFSLREFHTQPIYVLCDDATKEMCHKLPQKGVVFDVDANLNDLMKTEHNPASVKNSYHRPDCIAKKMDCIERATALFGNTLFLDADIVAVGPLYADITKPVMVSPHYHANDVDKNIKEYGVYNAGYVFNSEPDLPEFWREIYRERSSFYEQQGMVYFHEKFDVGRFPPSHNIGFWRYPKRNGRYVMERYPEAVKSFHAHLTPSLFGRAPQGLLQAYETMKAYVMSYLSKTQPEIYSFATSTENRWTGTKTNIETTEAVDDWGNCNAIFGKSHKDGKFNLGVQPALKTHRGGWLKVLEAMQPLHNKDGVYCETFVESVFDWFRFKHEKDKHIPITEPWVGFIHNPHNMPSWYKPAWDGKDDPMFEESLKSCIGMYTMSEYHAEGLRARHPGTRFEAVLHPYPTEDVPKWRGDSANQLIGVGWWLRKQTSIYTVQVPKGWRKIKLWPYREGSKPIKFLTDRLDLEVEHLDIELPTIEHKYHLTNEEYDELLCNSVVLLDLWDTSANNTVLECIQREVPIIVKDHPAVREYLGDDYPLYFNDLDEVHGLLDLVKLASVYLSELRASGRFTMDTFIEDMRNSEIYKRL